MSGRDLGSPVHGVTIARRPALVKRLDARSSLSKKSAIRGWKNRRRRTKKRAKNAGQNCAVFFCVKFEKIENRTHESVNVNADDEKNKNAGIRI